MGGPNKGELMLSMLNCFFLHSVEFGMFRKVPQGFCFLFSELVDDDISEGFADISPVDCRRVPLTRPELLIKCLYSRFKKLRCQILGPH